MPWAFLGIGDIWPATHGYVPISQNEGSRRIKREHEFDERRENLRWYFPIRNGINKGHIPPLDTTRPPSVEVVHENGPPYIIYFIFIDIVYTGYIYPSSRASAIPRFFPPLFRKIVVLITKRNWQYSRRNAEARSLPGAPRRLPDPPCRDHLPWANTGTVLKGFNRRSTNRCYINISYIFLRY